MREKHYRSVAKAISWRVTGTVDTFLVAWLITGKVLLAISIGGLEIITKLCLYYIHERAWNKSNFGRIADKPPDYDI